MRTSREALIRSTVARSLLSGHDERAIDRVAALGFGARRGELASDRIGSLVLRTMGHDEAARAQLVQLVARCIRPQSVNISASRVAATVLAHFIDGNCPVCGGRKMIYGTHAAAKVCTSCNGTGKVDTRRNPPKVGGKVIPDKLFALTYALYADGLGAALARSRRVLGG